MYIKFKFLNEINTYNLIYETSLITGQNIKITNPLHWQFSPFLI